MVHCCAIVAAYRLATAELIFRRGAASGITYVFKHALVRDAAYESLLRKRRQELHGRCHAGRLLQPVVRPVSQSHADNQL